MANTIDSSDLGTDQTKTKVGDQPEDQTQAGQAPVAPVSSAPTSANNNPNKQTGSGFTNISKIVQANQGNQLGSTIGNNIQQVGNAAQDNLKNAQNNFQQQSQQNQFNTNDNQQLVKNVLNDPTQFTSQDQNNPNSQQGNQFTKLISGQYQGPQGLDNANQIQSQAANVGQMGKALGTSGGRIGLLQQMVGNPNYQQGQQNLDNLLLGQSNDPALQAARRQALTLQGQTNSAITGAQAQGQQFGAEAKEFGQGVQNQLGQSVTAQNQSLQQKAQQAQQDRDSSYQQMLADLKSGNVTQNEADQFGLTNGESVYNVLNDPSKFLKESALKASAQNVAGANDYARLQALQNLAGQYASPDAQKVFSQYQNPNEAGQFNNDQGILADKSGFQNALNASNSDYHSQLDPVLAHYQQLQKVNDLVNQASGMSIYSPQHAAIEAQIAALAPGAVTNGNTNTEWAKNELARVQGQYNDVQKNLQNAYGTPETINIGQQPQTAFPNIAALNDNQNAFRVQ